MKAFSKETQKVWGKKKKKGCCFWEKFRKELAEKHILSDMLLLFPATHKEKVKNEIAN